MLCTTVEVVLLIGGIAFGFQDVCGVFVLFSGCHMACHACQLRRLLLQTFCLLTEATVLSELTHYISSPIYKYVVVDQSKPFQFKGLCGVTFNCTPLEENLKVSCRVRALNRTWVTRTLYIKHSVVIATLEALYWS